MMKSYLRYEPARSTGVISTPQCNAIYDWSGNLAISGALQNIAVWNLRQAQQIASLTTENPNYPYHLKGTVTCIARSTDRSTMAAGYSNGEIVVYDYINKIVLGTLRGHRSAVHTLSYDPSGTLLASGGSDSDVFVWDIVALTGRCKLRGHKDIVTGCVFICPDHAVSTTTSPTHLITSSKDTLIKVWDLSTKHCIQTIVGHRCEIWCIALLSSTSSEGKDEPGGALLLTGSSDDMIRGYRVKNTHESENDKGPGLSDDEEILVYVGSMQCEGGEKCSAMTSNPEGDMAIALTGTSAKTIETFRLRSSQEIKKKTKRRLKRQKEKSSQLAATEGSSVPVIDTAQNGGENTSEGTILSDMVDVVTRVKSNHKMKSLAFSPQKEKDGSQRILVSTVINTLEVFRLSASRTSEQDAPATYTLAKQSVLELHGHRSDVRAVCISSDGLQIGTCSAEGVKIWSSKSYSCVRSCPAGYGVTMAFVTGNRYVILGTKEGRVQIVDAASGEMVVNEEAHEGAIWSLAIQPPDGKAFMTGGADKVVKFWDFTVEKGVLGIELSRQLMMTHDVMSVCYSPVSRGQSVDRLMVAVGLLDHTVKVFYNDSLKFYLSLYGHKLPVMCMDISYDGSLLASGSADKTIKIWGLDFGDCHRSLLGHEDTVTAIKFQPETHYFFSSSKDGNIKYWDADRFEQILFLPGHISSAWALAVSPDASFVISTGQDRSIRMWERTEDMVFIEEERERALEAQVDESMEKRDQHDNATGAAEGSALTTSLPSIESLKGGERIMEALELVEVEYAKQIAAKAVNKPSSSLTPSLLLRNMTPLEYMCWTLKDGVKSSDLELALMVIPFHMVQRLLFIILMMCRSNLNVEICARTVVFLVRCHQSRILSTSTIWGPAKIGCSDDVEGVEVPSLHDIISELKTLLRESISSFRDLIGTNVATMKYIQREVESKRSMFDI